MENTFRKKKCADTCFCLCVNLLTIKIWGQSEKFPMSFSFSQCSLQIRRAIFTSIQPKLKTAISLPIFNFFFKLLYFKVTVYLQFCLGYKAIQRVPFKLQIRKTPIKLKLIGLAIRLYQQFLKRNKLSNFLRPLNTNARITF